MRVFIISHLALVRESSGGVPTLSNMGSVMQKERKRPHPMALRVVLYQRQLKQDV